MAHELEIANGKASMFFVGETPWHELGTRLEGQVTSEQAIKAAGLDWRVGLKPLFAGEYRTEGEGEEAKQVAMSSGDLSLVSHKATYRETDGKILGVVGPGWRPLQNVDAFKFFDTFVNAGQAAYETAGSLRGGTRIWILASLGGDPMTIVKESDDTVRKFLLLSNSHDGSLAVRVGFTPIRVVCANTLAMAHNDDASNLIKIRHHGSVEKALEKVGEIMNTVNAQFEATAEQYRALAACGCDETTLKKYVNLVFAPKRVEKMISLENPEGLVGGLTADQLRSNVYPKIAELFETGRGNNLPGVRGTLWAGYNAITEYLVHERGKDSSMRLDSAWFGQGHAQNRKALKVGVDLAALVA